MHSRLAPAGRTLQPLSRPPDGHRQPARQRTTQQTTGNAPRHNHAARAVIQNPLFNRSITGSADNKSRETPSETELEFRKVFRTSLKPPPRDLLLEAKTKEFLYDPIARSIAAAAANIHDPCPAIIGRVQCNNQEWHITPQNLLEGASLLFLNNRPDGHLRATSLQDVLDLTTDYLAGIAMLYEMYTRTLFAASRAVTELAAAHAAQTDTPLVPLLCEHCGDQLSRVDESHPKTCTVILRKKKEWEENKRSALRHASSELIDDFRRKMSRACADHEAVCSLARHRLKFEAAKLNKATPQHPPSSQGAARLAEEEEEPLETPEPTTKPPQTAPKPPSRRSSATKSAAGGKRLAPREGDDQPGEEQPTPPPSRNPSRNGSITSTSSRAPGANAQTSKN